MTWGSRFTALALLLNASWAWAGSLVLAVPLSLQPYFIPITDAGLSYETVVAAFKTQGIDVQAMLINPRVSSNQWKSLTSAGGGIDCSAFMKPEQVGDWFAVDDVYAFHDQAISLQSKALEIKQISDLKDKSIIAYDGASQSLGPEFLEMAQHNPRYREIGNHRAQVQLLERGRVDIIISDKLLTQWYLKHLAEENGTPIAVSYHDLFPPELRKFACRTSALTNAFSAGLKVIRENGTLQKIQAKYLN